MSLPSEIVSCMVVGTVNFLYITKLTSCIVCTLNRYYCLAAAAALVKYVEFTQNMILAPASINVIFSGCENTTMIGKKMNKS